MINTDWAKAEPGPRCATTTPPICAACATTATPITAAEPSTRSIDLAIRHRLRDAAGAALQLSVAGAQPNGQINVASMLDMQDVVQSQRFADTDLPAARLVDAYDYAEARRSEKLGASSKAAANRSECEWLE